MKAVKGSRVSIHILSIAVLLVARDTVLAKELQRFVHA